MESALRIYFSINRSFIKRLVIAAFFIAVTGSPMTLSATQRPAGQPTSSEPPQVDRASYSSLRYRYIGPPGNRAIAVAGVPGDPSVYYVGAASGGIWKTTDGGVHWQPIFDDQPVASIGSLAIAPSDHNTVWAGTGETFIRSHIS
ncbi:MAG TPA: hypothetical protein VJQ56_09735, partial [Blastocatellia bacterium]|nr:hypothetical protein [Blastocatellia bacterium]